MFIPIFDMDPQLFSAYLAFAAISLFNRELSSYCLWIEMSIQQNKVVSIGLKIFFRISVNKIQIARTHYHYFFPSSQLKIEGTDWGAGNQV